MPVLPFEAVGAEPTGPLAGEAAGAERIGELAHRGAPGFAHPTNSDANAASAALVSGSGRHPDAISLFGAAIN